MNLGVCGSTRTAGWTVRDVLEDGAGRMRPRPSPQQGKVLRALTACRTSQLGATAYQCRDCHQIHLVYCGCGNRHCPGCQARQARQWLHGQQARLLSVPYFHLVLTLPHALNPLVRQNREPLYELLFAAASQTLLQFGRERFGGEIGMTMVLHTWGQRLNDHYHVHAIVTGGGWSPETGWQQVENIHYLFPIAALSLVFRAKFCEGLQHLRREGKLSYHGEQAGLAEEATFQALVRTATAQRWVVYAKKPFAGPETVLGYLSNYTHRVGMSARRIEQLDRATHEVTFRYRDYALGGLVRTMRLDTGEFTRRFCLHILPKGFTKVRHYGLLANRGRARRLEQVRAAIALSRPAEPATVAAPIPVPPLPPMLCPFCQGTRLRLVGVVRPGRPGDRRRQGKRPGLDSS